MLTIKRLDINDARLLIAGARAKAQEIGVPMGIAVTDESGALIAFEKMDGAKILCASFAIDKSFTATGTRKGTHELNEANQPGKPTHGLASAMGGRILVLAGGLPIFIDNVVVGGIGVSSGSPAQDLEVAQAGVKALLDR
ncbi:MAG: heme-binding protein [Granulosicoccus sp.]